MLRDGRLAHDGGARQGPQSMRIAVFVLAVLVFAAGMILDTGALVTLVGGFLWAHALAAFIAALLAVAMTVAWRQLRRRKSAKTRGRAGRARRPAGPRQQRAGSGRGGTRVGKRARAK
jgi:membrane protein implicated in regulation of membrane protease activity